MPVLMVIEKIAELIKPNDGPVTPARGASRGVP